MPQKYNKNVYSPNNLGKITKLMRILLTNLFTSVILAQEWYEIYRQEYNILVFPKILGVYQVFSVYAFRIFFIIFPFEHLVVYFSLKHHILLRLYIAIWVQKYKEKRKSPNLFPKIVGKSPNLFLENVGKSPNL